MNKEMKLEFVGKIEMREKIKIDAIDETTYEDGTSWITYTTPTGETGYEITDEYESGDEEDLEKEINTDNSFYKSMLDKKHISSCSKELAELIYECLQSEEEMCFVEPDEIEDYLVNALEKEVCELGLDDYIKFYEDGCAVTVYGGIITQFLFSDEKENQKTHEVCELTGYNKVVQVQKYELAKIVKKIYNMDVEKFLANYTYDDTEMIQQELFKEYQEDTIEWCSNCEEEVTLKAELSVQMCPCCQEKIYACSICITQNCSNCPLTKMSKN